MTGNVYSLDEFRKRRGLGSVAPSAPPRLRVCGHLRIMCGKWEVALTERTAAELAAAVAAVHDGMVTMAVASGLALQSTDDGTISVTGWDITHNMTRAEAKELAMRLSLQVAAELGRKL